MYMCLIGDKPENITILRTYKGQNDLIKEIYKKNVDGIIYLIILVKLAL